jgi:hypothetical protein
VNWDLHKAEQALAGGERDEARVYAWNALATIGPEELTSLARIAGQLDDQLLILEIERRGLSVESERAPISTAGTLGRAAFFLVLLAAVVLTMFGDKL